MALTAAIRNGPQCKTNVNQNRSRLVLERWTGFALDCDPRAVGHETARPGAAARRIAGTTRTGHDVRTVVSYRRC